MAFAIHMDAVGDHGLNQVATTFTGATDDQLILTLTLTITLALIQYRSHGLTGRPHALQHPPSLPLAPMLVSWYCGSHAGWW